MISTAESYYNERAGIYSLLLNKSIKLSKRISRIRLLTFVFTAFLIIYFAQSGHFALIFISLLSGTIIFIALVRYHSKVLSDKKYREAVLKINEDEIKALNGNFSSFDGGNVFLDPAHPFSYDLDVFGDGSLFQFLNRTVTIPGRVALSELLKMPHLQTERIISSQEAIAELLENTNWRQDFQATGIIYEEKETDKDRILEWLRLEPLFSHSLFRVFLIIVPPITLGLVLLTLSGFISGMHFLLYLTLPFGILGIYAGKINRRHNHVSKTAELLLKYALLIKKIEILPVKSSLLVSLKRKIFDESHSASQQLHLLSRIVMALDTRLNWLIGIILNGLLLWDIIQMRRLEKWQRQNRQNLRDWLDAIAECDALISFANFRYNNPGFCTPEVENGNFEIEAVEVGHPLIAGKARVNNPVNIKNGQFLIVTGANMAGKSTYLRTIGMNLILAMCGAPVCANLFRFKPVRIYTSIHTSDSLAKNESYFYSELKRLKMIIDELQSGSELFIILDEILRGTNSKDKHAGSEALLKQLIRLKTSGIIATHDVDLGRLQETFPEQIVNRCFEGGIDGDRLDFSYQLKEGISKNMNATILMREMGITV